MIYTYYRERADFVSNDSRFDSWAMVVPRRGEFAFSTDCARGVCRFGSTVIVAPKSRFERHAKSALTYHVFRWDWHGSPFETALLAGLHAINDVDRLDSTLSRFKPLFGRNDEWSRLWRENLLRELLLLCVAPPQNLLPAAPQNDAMNQAAQLLQENAGRAFSMRFISDALELSPVQLTRQFRAVFGETPIEYLTRIRMERAAAFLLETNDTLETIAHRCGYATPFYLSNLFRQYFGQSPSEFRRKHRV